MNIKELVKLLGKNSRYVKERRVSDRELATPHRIVPWSTANEDYLKYMGLTRVPIYIHQNMGYETEAPDGAFKFKDVPLNGKFTQLFAKIKKYKMAVIVENCSNGYVSGYAIK